MNQRATVIGWVFLTVGHRRRRRLDAAGPGPPRAADPRLQHMVLQDPKIFVRPRLLGRVLIRGVSPPRRIGWGGRRTAYLSALGFAIVLLNFVPISYFLTKSHNF